MVFRSKQAQTHSSSDRGYVDDTADALPDLGDERIELEALPVHAVAQQRREGAFVGPMQMARPDSAAPFANQQLERPDRLRRHAPEAASMMGESSSESVEARVNSLLIKEGGPLRPVYALQGSPVEKDPLYARQRSATQAPRGGDLLSDVLIALTVAYALYAGVGTWGVWKGLAALPYVPYSLLQSFLG